MPSNCLIFALWCWLRRGGRVKACKSDHGWWPHFFWTLDGITCVEYIPPSPNDDLFLPPPLYRGIVRTFTAIDE